MPSSISRNGEPGEHATTGEESGAACTFCGQPITGDPPERSPGQSNPCEYCSSPSGGYLHSIVLPEAIGGAAAGIVEGATHPRILLRIARLLLDRNDDKLCGIAMIVMHVACDVAIERKLSDSFDRKGIPFLDEPVADILNGYNLANDKVRNVYASLTGDEIREQPFWDDFIRSAKRRDQAIRKGAIVSRTDAEESFKAVNGLLAHVTR